LSETRLAPNGKELIRAEMRDVHGVEIEDMAWEEYYSIWEALDELEDGVMWGRALVCAAIDAQYGEESVKAFASDCGIGESTAYRYRRTWMAFPRREDRFPELSFTHHAHAAMTNDPHYWIEDAALHGLSTYAMEKKIRKSQQRTKAAIVEETKKALEAGETPPEIEDVEIPANHNVPLSPARPATYSAQEEIADQEDLLESCTQWFFDRVEEGFLVSQIVRAMKEVIDNAKVG